MSEQSVFIDMDPEFYALIGTLFGGAGLKLIEKWAGRKKDKDDMATQLRNELRADVKAYREEAKRESAEADKWQDAYWQLVEERAATNAASKLNDYKVKAVADVVEKEHPGHAVLAEIKDLPS